MAGTQPNPNVTTETLRTNLANISRAHNVDATRMANLSNLTETHNAEVLITSNRSKRPRIDNYSEVLARPSGGSAIRIGHFFEGLVDVDFLVSPTEQNQLTTIMTSVLLASEMDDIDTHLLNSYVGSIICSVIPDMKSHFKTAMFWCGAKLVERNFPETAGMLVIEPQTCQDPRKALLAFCQCVLILYKNINAASYTRFMNSRLTALAALLGVRANDGVEIVFNVTKAEAVRTTLGAHRRFKAELLMFILCSVEDDNIGGMCTYLCGILAWNEMSAMTFCHDMLIATNSPVLRDKRVLSEVRNLADAFEIVCNHPYPQFFRILAPDRYQMMINRARFPTLVAVAQKLRGDIYSSVSQFAMPQSTSLDATVADLIAIHKNTVHTHNVIPVDTLEFLTRINAPAEVMWDTQDA